MKSLSILVAVALVFASTALAAQVVKGNEAVRWAGTSKQVDLPPVPSKGPASQTKPCAADGGCHAGAWYMVETSDGLRECTEPFARPTSCRASTYRTTKSLRLWVVESKGEWLECQYPDLGSRCVKMFARPPANLPYPAIQ